MSTDLSRKIEKQPILQATHPIKLYLICFISMWERYAFYTLRAILVLYMTKKFLFTDTQAYSAFAMFSAIVYLTPLIGGYLADKILGMKRSIMIGGSILIFGYVLLATQNTAFFYLGLSTICIGGGLFIPNIASMVGQLYQENDMLRESGFSIFYTSTNIGAFIPPLVTAFIVFRFGWNAAFIMAAISMLFSVIICGLTIQNDSKIKGKSNVRLFILFWLSLLSIICFSSKLIQHTHYANIVLFCIGILFFIFIIQKSFFLEKEPRNKLIACLILITLSIVFSLLYEQSAMSLMLFTEFNTHRQLGNWTIPTITFQSLNPLYIIIMGPLLAKLWIYLSKQQLNPSVTLKFGLGTCFMGLGFVLLPLAILLFANQGMISLWWVVASYFLQTLGEMFVSPIGLSMVSSLSPAKMLGVMMGVWYFATAVANALSGFAANLTTISSHSNLPVLTSATYEHAFALMGALTLFVGICIIALSPLLSKMIGKKSFST
ncbi:MAG: peptide MFS transporter [Legionellales bacterium]|nr:peptide MFS transporter [Legionellales bacterium]